MAIVAMLLSVLFTFQRYATYRRMFLAYDHDSRFIRQTIWLNEQRVAVLRGRGMRLRRTVTVTEAAAISNVLRIMRRGAVQVEHRRNMYESAMWRPWSLLGPEPVPSEP